MSTLLPLPLEDPCTVSHALALPRAPFTHGWNLPSDLSTLEFNLGCTPRYLILTGVFHGTAQFDQSLPRGSFHAGLWEHDVLELFIRDAHSKAYQEFNLSPSGAWWSALFSEYRMVSADPFIKPVVSIDAHNSSEGWKVGIKIERSSLMVDPSSTINVCAISGHGQERRYYSALPVVTDNPDFHAIMRD